MPSLEAYACFFASERSIVGAPHLIPIAELEGQERARYSQLKDELFGLHAALDGPAGPAVRRRLLLSFDDSGPIVIVCPEAPEASRSPLADDGGLNYTRLHRFADADALLEVFGHIRALNPDRQVLHRLPSDTRHSDLQHHLVVLGGIGWNPTLRRVQTMLGRRLPIEQVDSAQVPEGEVFRVHDERTGEDAIYFPVIEKNGDIAELTEDVGLVARLVNPYNSSRTLTLCNGVHSTGVMGAVLALTDETLRPANEAFLAEHYPDGEFAMLVRVPVIHGSALAPDLWNPSVRLHEWAPSAQTGE